MNWVLNAFGFLCKGGPVMVPLIICSIVSVAVMIERYVVINRARGDSDALMSRLENFLALGKYQDAARACEYEQTPLGDMLACGLKCSNARPLAMNVHSDVKHSRLALPFWFLLEKSHSGSASQFHSSSQSGLGAIPRWAFRVRVSPTPNTQHPPPGFQIHGNTGGVMPVTALMRVQISAAPNSPMIIPMKNGRPAT